MAAARALALTACIMAGATLAASSLSLAQVDRAPDSLESARLLIDPSPRLGLESRSPLAERPAVRGQQLATDAVRVHVSGPWSDSNLDGISDRSQIALDTAARTLALTRSLGLGGVADDGDGELDIYLQPLDDRIDGYAALDAPLPPSRGGSGFIVLGTAPALDDAQFAALTARSVARLVLAAHDARAPVWWTEASALWIQHRVAGPSDEVQALLVARWAQADTGLLTDDPLLARGNVGLLWSLQDPELESRALVSTWKALASRSVNESALWAIQRALRTATGLDLAQLQMRAGIDHIVRFDVPPRVSARVEQLPLANLALGATEALGVSLVDIRHDPASPEGTHLTLRLPDYGWQTALLVERDDGQWDRVQFQATGRRNEQLSATIPWQDYRQAVALVVRNAIRPALEPPQVGASPMERLGPFGLSSFGAVPLPGGTIQLTWTSAWEQGLYGWLVERAGAAGGAWTALNEFPVPSVGLPREGSGYSILDPAPPENGPIYYRVVAVTPAGLRVSGPPIVVQAPAP